MNKKAIRPGRRVIMKLILITEDGVKRVDCKKVEISLKPGYLVIDEDYSVSVHDVLAIVEG